jgi:HPt (histidine-containing phosphotransfer) domain-containing protein
MPDLQPLDTAVLDELCAAVDGDRAFVVDLAETFLTDAARQLDELEAACAANDAAAAVRPAHTLKSSGATVGALALAAAAREAEAAARAGNVPAALLDELRQLWPQAAAGLRAWIDGGVGG